MKRNILFVDDDQAILDGFKSMMYTKRKEWRCHFATSGAKGLKLLEKAEFDVVIADMRMPGMDGADFLAEVAERQPGAIRMILSGYSDMASLLKSASIAHQFMTKPCSTVKVIETIQRVIDLSAILGNDRVRKIVARLEALPVIPDLFVQITRELENPEPNIKAIGKMVERDVGISATLMKVVNSSFFGFYENVSSPARAVTLLGTETVKGLVLGVQFMSVIDLSALNNYSVEKLWNHSLETGYFAKTIAAMESQDKDFIETCFLAGILHDVGKLVCVTKMNDVYSPVLECTQERGGPVFRCEQKQLGVTHAEVGAYLLGVWGFKTEVVEAVNGHHAPKARGMELRPETIVHVANTLQHELKRYSGYTHSLINGDHLASLGLNHRLDEWREACKERWNDYEE